MFFTQTNELNIHSQPKHSNMQFATLALFAVAAATSTLAAATGVATGGSPIPASQCNTGPVQCCNETGTTKDASIAKALALVGVDVSDVNVLIGLTCDPISVIGIGGNSW